VTWKIYDMKKLKKKIGNLPADRHGQNTFFLIDWSQSVPNMSINVKDIWCDCLVWTGHKMMAYTGIGIVYLKNERIKLLSPLISWWGAIEDVDIKWYKLPRTLEKFEAWTPNIIWAISLLKSLEYIKSIWWIKKIYEHEQKLIKYTLNKFKLLWNKIKLIWPLKSEQRVGVFSFVVKWLENFNLIWEKFAEKNICIRCGWHCAYPLHKYLKQAWTCRMSLYFYNDEKDIDKFFSVLEEITGIK
jgi:cysteine desulfurase/selenocysteine lyase